MTKRGKLPSKVAVLTGATSSEREVSLATGRGVSKYDCELLIEKFVSGRELTIGIRGEHALPILEIIPRGGFYDFANKCPFLNPQAGGGAEHVCPARIDEEKTVEIIALSRLRSALQRRGYNGQARARTEGKR